MISVRLNKIGSVTSRVDIGHDVNTLPGERRSAIGDVVIVRAISESATYGNLELPTGRLARINAGDIFAGALGKRRALKGFVGDVPDTIRSGDRLHLLNMGGVIGLCKGHHSSFSDAIEVEVLGIACSTSGTPINISDHAIPMSENMRDGAPIILVAGTCMNSGKTVAAAEIVKQAVSSGLKVAGAKLSGIACLRDTLQMQDNGAIAAASFLDSGLPSTVDSPRLAESAISIFNHLNAANPDIIVAELGDGIVGGYSVEKILADRRIMDAVSTFVFCASDYIGIIGGMTVLRQYDIDIDVIAGSVTDSPMGERFIVDTFRLKAGNAKRDGHALFELVSEHISMGVAA